MWNSASRGGGYGSLVPVDRATLGYVCGKGDGVCGQLFACSAVERLVLNWEAGDNFPLLVPSRFNLVCLRQGGCRLLEVWAVS